MTPSARTKAMLEALGFLVGNVEKRLPIQAKPGEPPKRWNVTLDLFGFADFVAVGFEATLFVQATSASHYHARLDKIFGEECRRAASMVLGNRSNRIVLVAWAGKRLTNEGERVVAHVIEFVRPSESSRGVFGQCLPLVCRKTLDFAAAVGNMHLKGFEGWYLADGSPCAVLRRAPRRSATSSLASNRS